MAAMTQDSATGDEAGGIIRSVKDYSDQAMANLKAGRLKETYLFANEALELDEKDAKAAALYRHALYALHPKKRLLDKAKELHEEAVRYTKAENQDKALELLSLAKKWHCTPGILHTRANIYSPRSRSDLTYVDMTEGLAQCKEDKVFLATGQRMSLCHLGYKVLPVVVEADPVPQLDEMPARYHSNNWPKGLQIDALGIFPSFGLAVVEINAEKLKPYIPLDQLAQFLNHHLQDAMRSLAFMGQDHPQHMGRSRQDVVPRLLDEVIVPGRLHVASLNFADFFRLPWAGIERILDGRTLRAKQVNFFRLQLPSGVDVNELLKLPTVRECTLLRFWLYRQHEPQLPGLPPLFYNAALLEWIKRGDGRSLEITSDYLSSGLLSFLDALKKDFRQATQVHSYALVIRCPHMNVVAGLGLRNQEQLSNRLGEKMGIEVGEDRTATAMMGHRFETVSVRRLPPS